MIQLYYNRGPNPMKVALFLEEAGLVYNPVAVDTAKGEQHNAEFSALNPNNKVPAIIDGDAVVFDSSAILLYLAEKTGLFLSDDNLRERGALLSWLLFVGTGVGPFMGQASHFRHFAPDPKTYALDRYTFEGRRHMGVLDRHLDGREWMVSDRYTIVDMSIWAWTLHLAFILGDEALEEFPHVVRLGAAIGGRPAASRALALKEMHSFKPEQDAEYRRNMFRHLGA
jgi:GSH-dependent disulfide-bond oxidoreductase